MIRPASCVLAAAAVVAGTLVALAQPAAAHATPVLGRKIIGYSVQHRPIVAYHLGNPQLRTTSLILGQMHGDEHAGVTLAKSIIHGTRSVEGINLWVIPTMNPDGDAAHTRQNAHGVDLNRNWPNNWRHLTGQYYSGRKPLSEPETRAMWRFLRHVRPKYVVSLHQPLYGVDATAGHGKAYRSFRLALAHNLGLPTKDFECWSKCYGSMSGWYERKQIGVAAETVEFGWHPAHRYLVGRARRGIVAALHGRFGSLARHDPRLRVRLTAQDGRAYFSGWAYDIDAPRTHLIVRVREAGATLARRRANAPSAALRRVPAAHGFAFSVATTAGRHRFCLRATNLRAGAHDTRTCVAITVPAQT